LQEQRARRGRRPQVPRERLRVSSLSTFRLSELDLVVDFLDEIPRRLGRHELTERRVHRHPHVANVVVPLCEQRAPGWAFDKRCVVELCPLNIS
jgi:hypothetical protein